MSTLLEYKCPACGGALEFDSKSQKLACPFCDSTFTVEELSEQDAVLDNQEPQWDMPSNHWTEEETQGMRVYVCNSCGGEIVGDENTSASQCPYCGNQVVVAGNFTGKLKPDVVIPFKLDKAAAVEKYKEHIKGKFLLPRAFRTENHIDELKGIYVPFWLYDTKAYAGVNFHCENVSHWSDSDYHYTKTDIYNAFRAGDMCFEHIPCDGSSKMPDDLMESIEPFDYTQAVPFHSGYLAGYFADKYDVDENENASRAYRRIQNSCVETLGTTVTGYDHVHLGVDGKTKCGAFKVLEGKVSYALYPVWLLSSTYKGQKYTFAMNGQTGKFVGNLPCHKGKFWGTFFGLFAGLSVVLTALLTLFLN